MIAILLFVVAVVNGQNYGHQQSRDNQHDSHWISRLTGHRSDDNRCPSLTGANNNDFNNIEGLWFRIEEAWSERKTQCSIDVYQLTSHKTQELILRNPDRNRDNSNNNHNNNNNHNRYSSNDRDEEELQTGSTRRIDQSSWLTNLDDHDNNQYLTTVLASDYKKGYALVHLCNTRDSSDQIARILSTRRTLDQQTRDRLRNVLNKNGLSKLESQLRNVQQDRCPQENQRNNY